MKEQEAKETKVWENTDQHCWILARWLPIWVLKDEPEQGMLLLNPRCPQKTQKSVPVRKKSFSLALVQVLQIKWSAEPKLFLEEKSTVFSKKQVTQQLQIPVPEASTNVYHPHH